MTKASHATPAKMAYRSSRDRCSLRTLTIPKTKSLASLPLILMALYDCYFAGSKSQNSALHISDFLLIVEIPLVVNEN
jgi:hypothetical protein